MDAKIEEFFNMIKENPTLPIVPMVDGDVVGDDCGRWMGSFGHSYVGEYAIYKDKYFEDREAFYEEYYDYHEYELCEQFNYNPSINEFSVKCGRHTKEQLEENMKKEALLNEYLKKIAEKYFIKAIIIDIDLPE